VMPAVSSREILLESYVEILSDRVGIFDRPASRDSG
jgi:hypothetical protein